ncbi:MAG: hypothetical protein U0441_35905 [Polyangiaceae bacterium]
MTAAAPKKKPAERAAQEAPRAPLAELGIGAAWIVGIGAACQIAAVLLHSNPLAVVMVQAVLVDLAAGRAGLRWDPAANDNTSTEGRDALRGVGVGAGASLAVIAVVLLANVALGGVKIDVHTPTLSLALGALRAIAIAARDTQLYAGLPLFFAARAGVRRPPVVVFAGLMAGSAIAFMPGATPANVVLAASVMAAAAALWSRDDAGWSAAGLVGGYTFIAGTALRGGLADVAWKKGALSPGLVADGLPAWLASALFVAVAVFAMRGASAGKTKVNSPPADVE